MTSSKNVILCEETALYLVNKQAYDLLDDKALNDLWLINTAFLRNCEK